MKKRYSLEKRISSTQRTQCGKKFMRNGKQNNKD